MPRVVNAPVSDEKNAAVRAFWMATSKLNSVASGVRMQPSTTPSVSTTAMKQRMGVPSGRRMPARSRSDSSAPAFSIAVTSAASSFVAFALGESMTGYRISHVRPPNEPVGNTGGAGASTGATSSSPTSEPYGGKTARSSGISSRKSTAMPSMKISEPKIVGSGRNPAAPAHAARSSNESSAPASTATAPTRQPSR